MCTSNWITLNLGLAVIMLMKGDYEAGQVAVFNGGTAAEVVPTRPASVSNV